MSIIHIQQFKFSFQDHPHDPNQKEVKVHNAGPILLAEGIVLDVVVGADEKTRQAMEENGLAVPKPGVWKALVDTGASLTAIDISVAQQLNLKASGIQRVHHADGSSVKNMYVIGMGFPRGLHEIPVLPVIECDLSAQPFHVLIGRDIMSRWHIVYNGIIGAVTISD